MTPHWQLRYNPSVKDKALTLSTFPGGANIFRYCRMHSLRAWTNCTLSLLSYNITYHNPVTGYTNLCSYTQGEGRIWLDDVECDLEDTFLANCSHSGIGIENCDHGEDVAVSCSHGKTP